MKIVKTKEECTLNAKYVSAGFVPATYRSATDCSTNEIRPLLTASYTKCYSRYLTLLTHHSVLLWKWFGWAGCIVSLKNILLYYYYSSSSSSVGRAWYCSLEKLKSLGHWFDSGWLDFFYNVHYFKLRVLWFWFFVCSDETL